MAHEDATEKSGGMLCAQHKDNLKNNPAQAIQLWNQLVLSARKKIILEEWQQATSIYERASETAEILFQTNPTIYEANRYIQTITERCYALRCSHTPAHLSRLVQAAKYQLKSHLLFEYSNDLLKPLVDVAFSPMNQVNQWMKTLFQLKNIPQHSMH